MNSGKQLSSDEVVAVNGQKQKGNVFAAYLLYAVSIMGLLNLLVEANILGKVTPMVFVDIIAYAALFIIAYFIRKGVTVAKVLYPIVAAAWYLVLIFFLSVRFGHTLDWYLLFIQFVVTLLALYILWVGSRINR